MIRSSTLHKTEIWCFSEFIGKTIMNSGLREKDINVLTLHRDGKVIPNPRSDRTLESDDKLLCFGKLASMKELIPEKTRKRRMPKVHILK